MHHKSFGDRASPGPAGAEFKVLPGPGPLAGFISGRERKEGRKEGRRRVGKGRKKRGQKGREGVKGKCRNRERAKEKGEN